MQLSADNAISYAAEMTDEPAAESEESGKDAPGRNSDMAKSPRTGSLRRAAVRASQSAKREAEGVPKLPADMPVDQLLSAIETQLIPRLMVNHRSEIDAEQEGDFQREPPVPGAWSSEEQVKQFASWCLDPGSDKVTEHVSDLLSRGVNLDAIYLFLIAPAAAHLGDEWVDDSVSFIDVQLGLTRMHQLINECDRIGFRTPGNADGRSILLAAAPGEQHTLGVKLAADFYERNGWLVSNLSGYDERFILERIAASRYTAIGFSLHNAAWLDALRKLLPRVRQKSMNNNVLMIVGGDFFVQNPGVGDTLGADIVAVDAHQAVLDTEVFLGRLAMTDHQVPV